MFFDLKLVDNLVGVTFGKSDLKFYLAGGSACIIAGYIDRMTRDFDFVDLGYPSQLSKVLKLLEPYDLLTVYFAALPKNYAKRAKSLDGFENISVYVFSREDIIASKVDRLSEKDIEDISILITDVDMDLLNACIAETYDNIVYPDRKERYRRNLERFRKLFASPGDANV